MPQSGRGGGLQPGEDGTVGQSGGAEHGRQHPGQPHSMLPLGGSDGGDIEGTDGAPAADQGGQQGPHGQRATAPSQSLRQRAAGRQERAGAAEAKAGTL